jgi:hypothetical protein
MKKIFKLVITNILIVCILLLGVEVFFRVFDIKRPSYSKTIFGSAFAPYVMFINSANQSGPYQVYDLFRKKFMHGKRYTNNWGFPVGEDFDFASPEIKKKPNEKIVFLTGGSAAAGAGASSNDKLITAVMERILNSSQNTYQYKVMNFANGGWIASQEFIGLALWGRPYDPDWVITMDGRNDIAVAFLNCHDAGYPQHYHQMDSYIYGYMTRGQGTSFYRGALENYIIKHSQAYRAITGKLYIPNNQNVINYGDFDLIAPKIKGDRIDRIAQFYINSLENIVCLFPKAKYILSFQPMHHDHASFFGLSDEAIKGAYEQLRTADCGGKNWGTAIAVFYHRSAEWAAKLVEKYKSDKQIYFINMSDIFPPSGEQRRKFFLDEAHLYDSGQELVGIYYAYKILASDFPHKAAEYENKMKILCGDLILKTPLDGMGVDSTSGGAKQGAGISELLEDGGMEDWRQPAMLNDWRIYGKGSSLVQEASIKKAGAYSAKVTRAGDQTGLYQITEVPADTNTYVLSGWVYQEKGAANRGGFIISFADGANASVYHSGAATGWEYLTVSAVNNNKNRLDATCVNYNTDGDVYFDEVTMRQEDRLPLVKK